MRIVEDKDWKLKFGGESPMAVIGRFDQVTRKVKDEDRKKLLLSSEEKSHNRLSSRELPLTYIAAIPVPELPAYLTQGNTESSKKVQRVTEAIARSNRKFNYSWIQHRCLILLFHLAPRL